MITRDALFKQKEKKKPKTSYQHDITDCEGTALPWMTGTQKQYFFSLYFC